MHSPCGVHLCKLQDEHWYIIMIFQTKQNYISIIGIYDFFAFCFLNMTIKNTEGIICCCSSTHKAHDDRFLL